MKIIQHGARGTARHNGVYRPVAEFALRPAGGGVDRSERQKGTRDMSYYSASPCSANELRWSCLKM